MQLAPFAGFQPFAAAAVQHHHQIGQLDSNVDAQPNKALPFKRQPVRQRAQARVDAGVDADAAGVAAFEQARGVAQFLLQADKVLMQQGFIVLADFRARQLGHGMQQQIGAADDFAVGVLHGFHHIDADAALLRGGGQVAAAFHQAAVD